MFQENNVSGKHESFQASTKWNFFSQRDSACFRKIMFKENMFHFR